MSDLLTSDSSTRQGQLVDHRYGKTNIRLMRLDRSSEPHRILEASLSISMEGAFSEAYAEGDNQRVLPTDTIKNTVYAFARKLPFDTAATFALQLAQHFTTSQEQVEKVEISVTENKWHHHADRPSAFVAGSEERETTLVTADTSGNVEISCGIEGLVILKSSGSGFSNFASDSYTALKETEDRILASRLGARWDFSPAEGSDAECIDFTAARARIRTALLDAFADNDSRSMQHTLYWMAEAALAAEEEIDRIFLRMPNKHCLLAPLEAIGLDNPNLVFVPTDEPAGMIEGTVERRPPTEARPAPAIGEAELQSTLVS